ncbi:MAG: efflux RND transporter periplasmic adaptor subunit [Desulfitobacterium sp.]
MKKKSVVALVLGVVIIGGGGFWAYQYFQPKPQAASLMTASVKKGTITQEITATGTVMYPEEVPLAFEQAGKVKEIYVEVGDTVTAGQALAQMDTETLQQEVAESVASLKEAELNWQQQKVEAEATIVKTKEALRTAEQDADSAYLENHINIAEQNVLIASNNLAAAQQGGDESAILQAKSTLAQAQADLIKAQNTYNGGAVQTVESAKADLEIAEAKLVRLEEKTSLVQAQTAVVKAQENLAKATLVAPADGVIIDIAVEEGRALNDTTTVMTEATGGELLLVESSVSQDEVTQIKVGQRARISLDSAPDDYLSARVSQVALKGTTNQNVTTFTVTMQMEEVSEALRPGMNANVGIIIAEAKDVLTVPSLAIQTQGDSKGVLVLDTPRREGARSTDEARTADEATATGEQSAQTQVKGPETQGAGADTAAGASRFVPVEVGLDDGTNVEIKSSLTEGQMIVVGSRSSSSTDNEATNSNSDRRTNMQPGGIVVPGMGGGGGGFSGGSRPVR